MRLAWWLLGGAAAGGLLYLGATSEVVTELVLARGLPSYGRRYAPFIVSAAARHKVDPWKLAALLSRESDFGQALTPKGPGGKGDAGHGHGLGQIDDRSWGPWLAANAWWDPAVNIDKAAEILAAALRTFGGDYTKAFAAYNAGAGNVRKALARGAHPDSVTANKNYSSDTIARAQRFENAAKGVVS